MTGALFYVSLALSAASFLVFAKVVWSAARPTPPADPAGGPRIESVQLPDPGAAAAAFAQAGPAATAAALSIFFMFVALVVSGVVELSVDTKTAAEAGAAAES